MTFHHHDEATHEHHDATPDELMPLPVLEPDTARAERTRLRCRAQFERRMQNRVPAGAGHLSRPRIAAAVFSGFCVFYVVYVVYVAALFATAISLGALHY